MSNRNLGYKYKGHSAPHFFQILARYVGISALLWILMSALGFVFLTDLKITDRFQMNAFADFPTAQSTVVNAIGLIVLSGVSGACAAFPALIALFSLQPRVELMKRKSGKSGGLSLILLKQVPTLVLICTEFILVSLGLGAAPQLSRSWTDKPNLISDWSVFVYELIYYPLENDHVAARWREAFAPGNGTRTLNVYLPAGLLGEPGSLPKLKKALGEAHPFFLTAPTFPALLAQVSFGQSAVEQKYLPPIVGENEFSGSVTAGKSDFFLRSEWHAVENEVIHKRGKSGLQWDRDEAVRMRLAQSQFQLFPLFRLGFMTLVHDNWQWKNIVSDDAQALDRLIDKILAKGTGGAVFQNIQLGEIGRRNDFVRSPFAPLDWPLGLTAQENRWLISKLDTALGIGLSELKERKDLSIFVIPFPEQNLQSPFSNAFFRPAENLSEKLLITKHIGEQWLTPRDIFAAGQAAEVVKKNVLTVGRSNFHCLPLLLNPDILNEKTPTAPDSLRTSLWDVVRENSDNRFVFPSSFSFLPLSEFEPLAFCREFLMSSSAALTGIAANKSLLPPNVNERAWLFRMRPENALLENSDDEHQNTETMAQNLLREAVVEKVEKKSDRIVTYKRVVARKNREQMVRQIKALALFDAWEVNLKDIEKTPPKKLNDDDKSALLETFEPVLKNLFEQIALEQLN